MQTSKLIAANTIVQVAGKLITSGATLVVTILATRALGVSGYGDFTKIFAFVAFFYLLCDFGFNAIAVREITATPGKTNTYFGNLLALRIAWSAVLIFLVGVVVVFLPYDSLTGQGFGSLVKAGILVASFNILAQAIFITSNVIFQAKMRYDKAVLVSSLGALSGLLFVGLAVLVKPSLLVLVTAYTGGAVVLILASLITTGRFVGKPSLSFDFKFWKELIVKTLPISLTLIFNLIYFRIDMLILSAVRQTTEVGLYGLSYKVFDVTLSLPIFFVNALYPVLLQDYKEDFSRFIKRVKRAALIMGGTSVFLGLIIFLAAPLLVELLGGKGFEGSVASLRILILGLPLFYLSAIFQWLLIILGKQKMLAYFYAMGAILNVGLNLAFIPSHGYIAAAIITGLTELAVLVLLVVTSLQNLKQGGRID